MKYRFHIVDVFTDTRFGGNQLAVLPEAQGLSTEQMQKIAREFNFSESTFVLPATDAVNTRQVRIFTPTSELPFAGHPNVGTAFVLAACGALDADRRLLEVRFEERAGVVPISIRFEGGQPLSCELTAPEALTVSQSVSAELAAAGLRLPVDDIVTSTHEPVVVSVGLAFLLVEVASLEALGRAAADEPALAPIFERSGSTGVHVYTQDTYGLPWDLQARMFAPADGVPEDPATGSANCALAALLSQHDETTDGTVNWSIAQGIEMGRPSLLEARVDKSNGQLGAIRIGGQCVMVADGTIEI